MDSAPATGAASRSTRISTTTAARIMASLRPGAYQNIEECPGYRGAARLGRDATSAGGYRGAARLGRGATSAGGYRGAARLGRGATSAGGDRGAARLGRDAA